MCSLLQRISLDYQQERHGVSAFKDMSKRKFVSNCCSIFGSSYNSLLLCRGSANKYWIIDIYISFVVVYFLVGDDGGPTRVVAMAGRCEIKKRE